MHTYQYEGLSSPKTTIARAEFELPMEVLLPVEMGTKWLNEGSIDHLEGEEYVYRWEGYREKSGSAVLADQPGDRLVVEGA